MKTRKTVIAVLTAMLVISAIFIVGCIEQVGELTVKKVDQKGEGTVVDTEDGGGQVPVEKGKVKLNFSERNARTIFPDLTSFPLATMVYDVAFTSTTPANSANNETLTKVSFTDATAPVDLNVDTYNISIHAYKSGVPPVLIAQWDNTLTAGMSGDDDISAGVAVTSSSGYVSVTANLVGLTNGAAQGKFTYNVTYPALPSGGTQLTGLSYTSAVLEVLNSDGIPLSSAISRNLTVATNNSIADASAILLDSGFYIVRVTLVASKCQNRVVEEIIHIYPEMMTRFGNNANATTSPNTPISIPAPNQNEFTVIYNANATGVTVDDDTNYTSGTYTESDIANASPTTNIAPPTATGYTFSGWYQEVGLSTPWTPGSSRVFKDRTIYARWGNGIGNSITFNTSSPMTLNGYVVDGATSTDVHNGTTTYGKIVDGYNSSGSTVYDALKFVLDGGTFTNIVWTFDGVNVTSYSDSSTHQILTINSSSSLILPAKFTNGVHYLTARGELDGVLYSETITFTINN